MEFSLSLSTDPKERRRLQNRIAQRKFREKKDLRYEEGEPESTMANDPLETVQDDPVAAQQVSGSDDWTWNPCFPALPPTKQNGGSMVTQGSSDDNRVVCADNTDFSWFDAPNEALTSSDTIDKASEASQTIPKGYANLGLLPHKGLTCSALSNRPPPKEPPEEISFQSGFESGLDHPNSGSHQFLGNLPSNLYSEFAMAPGDEQNTPGDTIRGVGVEGGIATDSGWLHVLHIAAKSGHERMIHILMQRLPNCNQKDSDGRTALMYAVIADHICVVNVLLAHGARVGDVDNDRRSVLHWAILHCRESIIVTLLQHHQESGSRLDLDIHDSEGLTPLHMAVEKGLEQAVVLLLECGADLHSRARK